MCLDSVSLTGWNYYDLKKEKVHKNVLILGSCKSELRKKIDRLNYCKKNIANIYFYNWIYTLSNHVMVKVNLIKNIYIINDISQV